MKLPAFDYQRPQTSAEACGLLRAGGREAQPIAGGTELVLALQNRQKTTRLLVDLSGIAGLDQIRYSAETGLHIGSMVTLRQLAEHPDVRCYYPLLAQAAASAGSPQIQSMGTIGGNVCQDTCCQYFNRSSGARRTFEPCHKLGGSVCHVVPGSQECWATYAGDIAPALIALGATLWIAGADAERRIPVRDLFSGDGARAHTLREGEIVTAIDVPPAATSLAGQTYAKLRQRGTLDYGMLAVAARVELDDTLECRTLRVVLTGIDRKPVEITETQHAERAPLTASAIRDVAEAARKSAHPMKNLCELPPSYRRQMVDVFVESAVTQAAAAAGK
jgi:4-hydroxybenzoyl-CoA reductase subunit beta